MHLYCPVHFCAFSWLGHLKGLQGSPAWSIANQQTQSPFGVGFLLGQAAMESLLK